MNRVLPLMVLVLMIVGPTTGSREAAEAAPKPKPKPVACKVELAQTKDQLAELTKQKAELEALLAKERERERRLEEQLAGPEIQELGDHGPPAPPSSSDSIQELH